MKSRLLIPLLAMSLVFLSCTRDPIYDEVSRYHICFSIDSDVLYCRGKQPELIQVIFYDPVSGKKIDEAYMGPEGGYLYSFTPGAYDIVAVSMGSSRTELTFTKDFNLLTAQTKTIQSSPVKVIAAPDHMYAGVMAGTVIPFLSEADPPFELTIPMKSVCDSWKIKVTGVKGVEYSAGITAYVFNQTQEIYLKDNRPSGNCAIRAEGRAVQDEGVFEIPFCTFGMSDTGTIRIRVDIEALDRKVHSMEFDVTSQILDVSNREHLITVDFPTELSPMIQGGLDPSADKWDEHHEFVDIE